MVKIYSFSSWMVIYLDLCLGTSTTKNAYRTNGFMQSTKYHMVPKEPAGPKPMNK